MTSSVFIKTWKQDLPWVNWALKFLRKGWLTDSEFVIHAPHVCMESMKHFSDVLGKNINFILEDQWTDKGWIYQQYAKQSADKYCSGNLVTYIDSEAMLVYPTEVERDLCVDGRPIIWHTEYDKLDAPWRNVVSQILGMEPRFEFMRTFPFTYDRNTIKSCREHLESLHGMSLHDLMFNVNCWSEFNVLGFYSWVFQHSKYTWKHTDEMFTPDGLMHHYHDRIRQFHNVYDWTDPTKDRLKAMLESETPCWI